MIALIIGIIATVWAVMERGWLMALLLAAMSCIAFGLLFHA